LEEHEKHCNGINGRPTRIEMPKETDSHLYFKNYENQQKVPFVIYADLEGCELPNKQKSYTEKASHHAACGYAFIVVRGDGLANKIVCRRGENTVEEFLKALLKVEKQLRKKLEISKPLLMQQEDWINFKAETHSHICEKPLVKEKFLDSNPIFETDTGSYCGQTRKKCHYSVKFIGPRNEAQPQTEMDKWIKNSEEDRLCCGESLVVKKHRDAVKDHCHITGKYRGAAHD